MTQRSYLQIAALTSAAMPGITISGARSSQQSNPTDEIYGIDQAIVLDTTGNEYDVYASDSDVGKERLAGRAKASSTLQGVRQASAFSFSLDRVLAFVPGDEAEGPTGRTSVLVAVHHDGQSRRLDLLTINDCASVGTAIGAFHRLDTDFLERASYPVFTTGQIRAQLTGWIRKLRQTGQIPAQITDSWSAVIETDGLWSFATCPVHGGYSDGDFLLSGSSVTAVTNWQDMQVNDPARDLSWIFARLEEQRRNAILSAYGRVVGARLDDLIMLRANLWLQMEQVGDFIEALNRADNDRILQFKAQVERLAHQLGVSTAKRRPTNSDKATDHPSRQSNSTITVGTLLGEHHGAVNDAKHHDDNQIAEDTDSTNETDVTGESDITGERDITAESHTAATIVNDAAQQDSAGADSYDDSQTVFIPRTERDAKAKRDAQADLDVTDEQSGADPD